MTDSQKLDLLLEKVVGIETDVAELKKDMVEVKADIVELKRDVTETKGKIISLHRYSDIILEEVERVHSILDMHKADKKVHTA